MDCHSEVQKGVRVVNLSNNREMFFQGLPPEEAVIAAHAYARGDHNTWDYQEKYGSLVTVGDLCVCCGDWCALPHEVESVYCEGVIKT